MALSDGELFGDPEPGDVVFQDSDEDFDVLGAISDCSCVGADSATSLFEGSEMTLNKRNSLIYYM